MYKLRNLIFYLFAGLLLLVPLILWPFTSEVFEFNKIVLVYVITTLIAGVWTIGCVIQRRFIFRRTILDIPLLLFIFSQVISTLLSIDWNTSFYGYYSRFNGGLISLICYSFLYWAFVSNINKGQALKLLKIFVFSALPVSLYAVLQHLGVDKNIWVQDVQSRVFSTLGQPNWLAVWVGALIPLTQALMLNSKKLNAKLIYLFLSVLFFTTLLFTKSRSGLIEFLVVDIIFWALVLSKKVKENFKPFIVCNLLFVVLALVIGTQWTPSLKKIFSGSNNLPMSQAQLGTSIDRGGTESGILRKYVWAGAVNIWKNYPFFGTGVETFAFSYYKFRPLGHNLTSEWDFIYNKAHNEFLNVLANTGLFGLFGYMLLLGISVFQILNVGMNIENPLKSITYNWKKSLEYYRTTDEGVLSIALFTGFVGLSIGNFFGFSVVPTQLQFFLFPAMAVTLVASSKEYVVSNKNVSMTQKIGIGCFLLATSYLLLSICRYWYADILYAKSKSLNSIGRPDQAIESITSAIKLTPNQPLFYGEEALAYSGIASALNDDGQASSSAEFLKLAVSSIQKADNLAPNNLNIKRQMFGIYIRLSTVDENYLSKARDVMVKTIELAPTDAKLYYNLGITDANLGQNNLAISDFEKSIELKPNYADARIQYAALLVHLNQTAKAKEQLEYVLEKIDPKNETAVQALENLK